MQAISGLWVTRRNANMPWIWSKLTTPNIHQAFETSYNYLIYTFTEKIASTHTAVETNQCRLQNQIRSNDFEHLEGNLFLRNLGDSMALSHCKKTTVTINRNNTYCYNDVKLTNGYFLDKNTHLLKFNSSV